MADPVIRIPNVQDVKIMVDVDGSQSHMPTINCGMGYDTVHVSSEEVDGKKAVTLRYCSEVNGWLGRPVNYFQWVQNKNKKWDTCSNYKVYILDTAEVFIRHIETGETYSILSDKEDGANSRSKKIIETTLWCANDQLPDLYSSFKTNQSLITSAGRQMPSTAQLTWNVDNKTDETPVPAVPDQGGSSGETTFIEVFGAEPPLGYGGH